MNLVPPSIRHAALVGLLATLPALPSQAGERDTISLNSQVLRPGRLAPVPEALRAQPADREYLLVKFPGPVTGRQLAGLSAWSERVYTYLPHDTFLVRRVRGDAATRRRELRALGASFVEPYHPLYKLSRFVRAVEASEPADAAPESPRILMVQVFPDADLAGVTEKLEALGLEPVGAERNPFFSRVRLLLSSSELSRLREDIARIPEVFWLDLEPRRVLLNDTTVWVGQSGLSAGQTTPLFSQGLYGQGQVVGVIDTGLDPDSCYFRDTSAGLPVRNECNGGTTVNASHRKVLGVNFLWSNECTGGIANNEWDTQNHGTHVAGTIAGDNFANLLLHDPGDGMAPGAKLVIQDGGYQVDNCGDLPGIGCPVVDLNPLFQQTYDQGARMHSNSWGDQENAVPNNNYTAGSQDVDEFMWNHKDFLVFFAAGNSGPGTASVSSPSTAKSAVSVGSTQRGVNSNSMSSFSSCGPTDDQRIKPEITMPGSSIVSARNDTNVTTNNCNTISMSGTSMATPGAAGLTALIRQYYVDGWYPTGTAVPGNALTPSAALMRATLVNSATSMTGATAIPSNCQGWGRVLLDNALHFPTDTADLFVKDDATPFPGGSSGETRSYPVTITAGTAFKATLAWTDFPSTPAANPHINNDLDLEVTGPGGTFKGNVFSGGQSTTGGTADRRNTLEQVLLTAPAAGAYTVSVRSFNVPNGPQPFALVVTADIAPDSQQPTASVTFPTGGTVSGGIVTVTASASDNVGVTQVEFYIDGVLRCTDASSPYSCDWDVTSHKRLVSHSIYVKAYDAALNVGQSATVSVVVDNGL